MTIRTIEVNNIKIAAVESDEHDEPMITDGQSALELAGTTVQTLKECYPDEPRPQIALDTSRAWAVGDVKMRDRKRSRKNGTECILCFECANACPQKAI